eukprot:5014045-Amphidinium_carterae.1
MAVQLRESQAPAVVELDVGLSLASLEVDRMSATVSFLCKVQLHVDVADESVATCVECCVDAHGVDEVSPVVHR